jgi:hypothetical protein
MSMIPCQKYHREPRLSAAREAVAEQPGNRFGGKATPVAITMFDRMDVAASIEKDGTGIGTGNDMGSRPVLGAWSGLAQDVILEHGRSRAQVAHPAWRIATSSRSLH